MQINVEILNTHDYNYDDMDSYTYYMTKKAELLKDDNVPNQIISGSIYAQTKIVWGLDVQKQKRFYHKLCKKICYEYSQNDTSPFVQQMQERAHANSPLTPFEVSVLREAYDWYINESYEGLNMNEFNRSITIPQIKKPNIFKWYETDMHCEMWRYNQIQTLKIFELENQYRKKLSEKNQQTVQQPVTTSTQTQAPNPSATVTDDTELKTALERIRALEEQIKAKESERQTVIDLANEEAARIRTKAEAEAQKIKETAETEAQKIKENAETEAQKIKETAETEAKETKEKADKTLAEAETKAQTIFKNKLSKKILDQRAQTRATNIEEIKSYLKKCYAKPADLSKNSDAIVKSANEFQSIFSTAINDAIEKLKEEKTQMYEQIDQLKRDMYPTKEKLCIKWYLDYCGTWSKTGDTVIAALLSSIEANNDLDPDNKITGNLDKLSAMLEKFMVEFENAIAALGFKVFRPEVGDRYDSNEHRCSNQIDEEDTDDFNGRKIIACKKPGLKRIGLSGQEEVLEVAEVTVEE